jgi:uncharacterized protein YndB with AHSA1/START domain
LARAAGPSGEGRQRLYGLDARGLRPVHEWVGVHGPDGTDYSEWITWTVIVPPERIELLHGESGDDPDAFESVLTFEADGAATRIVMRTVFPSKQLRDRAVEKYHAIEGGRQTLSNLAAYVTGAEG